MKYLIKNGQLEIVTGGWVMPDEATTQLFGLLNQLIEGHQWLYEQFGILPETGWSIDPFGVGSTVPYLLAAADINKGYLIQRIHFAWKRFLAGIGGMDAMWRQDFTENCKQYDIPLRVQHSLTYTLTDSCGVVPKLCSIYDFNRAKKAVNFSNIHRKAEIPDKQRIIIKGDFFPYCDLNKNKMDCWTGYYTTRPFYKKLSRTVDSNLRATEILFTLSINIMRDKVNRIPKFVKLYKKLIRARRNSALFQHHDGITGTSKQFVMEYYRKSLLASLNDLKFIQKSCIILYYNLNLCNNEEEINVPAKLVIYNSLTKLVNADVTIIVNSPYVTVSYFGSEVDHQVVPQQGFNGKYNLMLYPTLPPLSITVFEIYPSNSAQLYFDPIFIKEKTFSLYNNYQKLYFLNGLLNFIEINGQLYKVILKLKGYKPVLGESGAYLFKPHICNIWSTDETYRTVTVLNGHLYDEVCTKFLHVTLFTRLYKYGDLATLVEISIESFAINRNIELIMELITDMSGDAKWYTDVNDFQCRQRINIENLCLEGNYYPMTSIIYVQNESWRLSLIADHSHGTNYNDGHLALMLNRRISTDDGKGIGEGIVDNLNVISKFYLLIENSTYSTSRLFSLAKILNNPLIPYLFDNNHTLTSVNFLNDFLDNHLHLLNFRTLSKNLNHPSKDALLILQNYHTNQTLQPFLTEIPFNGLRENKISTTTITGIKTKEEIDSFDEIKILPSSITAVKISF